MRDLFGKITGKGKIMTGMMLIVSLSYCLIFLTSCSESDEETTEEFSNWQARNDAFFMTLEDSLRSNTNVWRKWKCFTKNAKTAGVNTEYVYAKILKEGTGTTSPLFTDSVRISYRGRLIPSASYPQGYLFDQTFVDDYDVRTTDIDDGIVEEYLDGFATALQYMRKGERCVVYIPYQLGYGTSAYSNIPGCSVLVFDLLLIDFVTGTSKLKPWSGRQL